MLISLLIILVVVFVLEVTFSPRLQLLEYYLVLYYNGQGNSRQRILFEL